MAKNSLYIETYSYYRQLIEEEKLSAGERMPSLRECCKELNISKTTAESAYFQLVADGYIVSRERSGFFVSDIRRDSLNKSQQSPNKTYEPILEGNNDDSYEASYDFSKIGEDPEYFCFSLWQRYMKSSLRFTETLMSYGNPQGEIELREEISNYVKKNRNIYCTADDVVIGASTQSLLMILLPILKNEGMRTASVPAIGFDRYAKVFEDNDFAVGYRDKEADVIYVSPAHMTSYGEVMSLKRRYEITKHSEDGHIIIEDDYQNEFNYSKHPCPSIFALSKGENVVYLGGFSRVLMPSIRISFMILPTGLKEKYKEISSKYDQTASKTEQLALCHFLRDDQLNRHIRKIKRLYGVKRERLAEILGWLCEGLSGADKRKVSLLIGECGTEMEIRVQGIGRDVLEYYLSEHDMKCAVNEQEGETFHLLFSCGIIGLEKMKEINMTS